MDLPIACKLSGPERAARERFFVEELAKDVGAVEEMSDGFAFRFPSATLPRLLELVHLERECCPFLTFELVFEPAQGPIWLRIRAGREGEGKEFIRGLSLRLGPDARLTNAHRHE